VGGDWENIGKESRMKVGGKWEEGVKRV